MNEQDTALQQAIERDIDAALGNLVFDERLKAGVRAKIVALGALPAAPVRKPLWSRWQPYAWGTLAAAAVTGIVLLSGVQRQYEAPQIAAGPAAGATSAPRSAAAAPAPPSPADASPGSSATPLSSTGTGDLTAAPTPEVAQSTQEHPKASGPMATMSIQAAPPVQVEITPQPVNPAPGQPVSFTVRLVAQKDGGISLGSTVPRLVIKSLGTKDQSTAQLQVPDLAGQQLKSTGAQVSAQVNWSGSMLAGYYSVTLEGLAVSVAGNSTPMTFGGQQVLVRFITGDALVRNLTPNQTVTAQDVAVTLQRIEATADKVKVYLQFIGVPAINEESISLVRDGQDTLVPLSISSQTVSGGVLLTAEFNPLPAGTRSLALNVAELKVPGAKGVTTVSGPWQITVNP